MFDRSNIRLVLVSLAVGIVAFSLGRVSVSRRSPELSSNNAGAASESKSASETKPSRLTASPATLTTAVSSDTDWENRWRELAAKPASRGREQEMIAALEDLATRDPARALSLAAAEASLRLRLDLYRAALRGWGKVSPDAAADWVLSEQTAMERNDAMAAVLAGAVKRPDAALSFAERLLKNDPGHSRDHGVALIAALGGAGEFEKAARFAASGNEDNQEDWMTTAYSLWADYQPAAALASVAELSDAQAKRNAFNAAITSWSGNDPRSAAEYAAGLDAGDEKKFAITVALRNWAANDAAAAAEWIRHREPAPELDSGAASVAVDQDCIRQPSLAIGWAESIVDPELRSSTLATIIHQWGAADPAAALAYARTSAYLRPADRTEAIADFPLSSQP